MNDDIHNNMYEAQEYHPGGYPQIRNKRNLQAVTHKNTAKDSINTLWGLTLFGFISASLACIAIIWLV